MATLSLPDLRVEGIVKVLDQQQVREPEQRVLFGTTAVTEDEDWTYVFGGDDAQAASRPASKAYVARVPATGWRSRRRGSTGTAGAGPPSRRG